MNSIDQYDKQLELVTRVLPYIRRCPDFALKGGTAINLFFRDLPRLSVDIDLIYLPISPYGIAKRAIFKQLNAIVNDIRSDRTPQRRIVAPGRPSEKNLRVVFRHREHRIKVEVTPVGRGTVWPPALRRAKSARFDFLENLVASFEDVYGGKICAALSRQHPRDLFDIRELLAHEGIDRKLLLTSLVYLVGHTRPMSDLLSPVRKDIGPQYENEFRGMAEGQTSLEELVEAREQLIRAIHSGMTDDDRSFLMTVEQHRPDWSLIDLPGIEELPAIKRKLENFRKMSKVKRDAAVRRLSSTLEAGQDRSSTRGSGLRD